LLRHGAHLVPAVDAGRREHHAACREGLPQPAHDLGQFSRAAVAVS
jgi:hypothetical protein